MTYVGLQLFEQLKAGGRLIIPVGPPVGGKDNQSLMLVTKQEDGSMVSKKLMAVRYQSLISEEF